MRARRLTSRTDAEAVALEALAFLAGDPERLGRFLDVTGLRADTIRGAAGQPGFLAAVLDHIASDDALVVALADRMEVGPERIAEAQQILAGPPPAD